MIALTFPSAKLMGLHDLLTAHAAYESAIRAALTGTGPDLTSEQRGHAHEVGEQYREWRKAIRWSYARP